jgi:hypothetical protein
VHLRNGGVALVDKEQKVAREVVEQRGRRLAGQAAGEVARVVLDAVAVAHGLDHLEIEAGALVNALRLDHAAFGFKLRTHSLSSLTMESMASALRSGWTT